MARNRSKRKVSRVVPKGVEAELKALLAAIAPKVTPEKRESASQRILQAINDYLRSFPIADGDHRIKSGLSESRVALKAFLASAVQAESDLTHLPYSAKRAFCRKYGPLGGLLETLKRAASCADAALLKLDQAPDKESDDARIVLAATVGRALREMGSVRLSLTDPTTSITGSRGGAAYGRTMQLVLMATGTRVTQIRPLLRSGLELLTGE